LLAFRVTADAAADLIALREQVALLAEEVTELEEHSVNLTLTTTLDSSLAEVESAMTHMWLIICAALVMFMHAGFAMVESGCCRAGFVQSVLQKNLINCCIGTIGWYAIGWGLAYGDVPENGFAGRAQFFNNGFIDQDETTGVIVASDLNLNWFFQWAFCMTSATIVSGAVAERVQLRAYCIFVLFMTMIVYPVVVAWTWSCAGWLNYVGAGYMDFAGSGIVHLTGGTGALVGTVLMGPRDGRFDKAREAEFAPHSIHSVTLGTLILWFGWYGFNCGSTLSMSADAGKLAAQVAVNTTVAPAVGGMVVTLFRRWQTGRWSVMATCCGILAGLVSITAGCGSVHTHMAFVIAFIGSFAYIGAAELLIKYEIDDPVEAIPVHGACGIWGVLAAALFDWGGPDNFHGWNGFERTEGETMGSALLANLVGIIAIMAWSGTLLAICFKILDKMDWLRIPLDIEQEGLDAAEFIPMQAYTISFKVDGRTEIIHSPKRPDNIDHVFMARQMEMSC